MDKELDIKYLKEAHFHSKLSPDPSTKVGAVITQDMRAMEPTIIGRGHNCFPWQCDSDPAIYADRERKYLRIVHAEVNAIINASSPVEGGTLYVWPPSTAPSCARCAGVVITAGIKRVVYAHQENEFSARWAAELHEARLMYHEAGVEIVALRLSDDQIAEHFSVV